MLKRVASVRAICLVLAVTVDARAQSPFASRTEACAQACAGDVPEGERGPSPINPYFLAGGSVGLTLASKGDFTFSPFSVGKLQVNLNNKGGTLLPGLALISNLEAPDLKSLKSVDDVKQKLAGILNSNSGLSLVLAPYWTYRDNAVRLSEKKNLNYVLWGAGGAKLAAVKDSADTSKKLLSNWRVSAGVEVHYYKQWDDKNPLTFSIEPAWTAAGSSADYAHFLRTTDTKHQSLELNAIVPLAAYLPQLSGVLPLNNLMLDWSVGKSVAPIYRVAFLVLK
jgi:hypothetical protein